MGMRSFRPVASLCRSAAICFRTPLRGSVSLTPTAASLRQFRGFKTISGTPLLQDHDEFTRHDQAQEEAKAQERQRRDEEDRLKSQILDAGLKHVVELGWSRDALQAGAQELGFPATLSGLVAEADIALVHHQFKVANDQLELEMQQQVEAARAQNQPVKVGPFLRRNVEQRLRKNIPFMSRWPEALALRAHPTNAVQSLFFSLELVDSLWHFAGDKSVDTNWYTKRLSLLAIYKSTEVAMMQDKSEDFQETWKFLDRRFEDHFAVASLLNNCLSPADAGKVFGGLGTTFRVIAGLPR